jgi:hypothetical protein
MPSTCCIVCGTSLGTAGLCGPRCVQQAEDEVRRNAARLRGARRRGVVPSLRYELAVRNGELMSAILRWPSHGGEGVPNLPGGLDATQRRTGSGGLDVGAATG